MDLFIWTWTFHDSIHSILYSPHRNGQILVVFASSHKECGWASYHFQKRVAEIRPNHRQYHNPGPLNSYTGRTSKRVWWRSCHTYQRQRSWTKTCFADLLAAIVCKLLLRLHRISLDNERIWHQWQREDRNYYDFCKCSVHSDEFGVYGLAIATKLQTASTITKRSAQPGVWMGLNYSNTGWVSSGKGKRYKIGSANCR